MRIGVPKEIKTDEYRVGLTPGGVVELLAHGHEVIVEENAGEGVGFSNEIYENSGARIFDQKTVFAESDLIIKVKEPQLNECALLNEGQCIFTFLHLAANKAIAEALMASGASCIAYETIEDNRSLPLLTPMSEIAGRLSVQAAAHCLEKPQGGRGILLGGVPGVPPASILVIGGGTVGLNAARMALGLGADVTIVDQSLARLRYIDEVFNGLIHTLYSNQQNVEQRLPLVDAVIGAVLVPGAAAPKLILREQLALLKPGTVLVDVAIDQGGCFETSSPTTHRDPTYQVDNILHYCVANIPGAVPRTSTLALTNASLPWVIKLANKGEAAFKEPMFAGGLNVARGRITHRAVAESLDLMHFQAESLFK